jgi:hypothetical protein
MEGKRLFGFVSLIKGKKNIFFVFGLGVLYALENVAGFVIL